MRAGPVLTALRTATRAAHERLEHRVDAANAFATAARRRSAVSRYYALHVPAEAQLAPWLAAVADLDFAARRRAPLILHALAEWGSPAPARAAPHFPVVRSRAEALGFLYVLEGSSLGGRVILRSLARRGIDATGLQFLDPYGALGGERWAGFVRVLETEAGGGAHEIGSAVSGATKGFDYAEACLCGDTVPA